MKIQVLFLFLMLALGARAQTVEEMVMTSTDADTCRGRWCSGQVEITQWDNYKVSIRIRRGGGDGGADAAGGTAGEATATVRRVLVELYAGTDSLLVWQTKKWEVAKDGTLADKAKGKFVDIGGVEGIMSTWALLDYLRTGKWYARIGDSWVKISRMVTD
jgi:hypothetical protein